MILVFVTYGLIGFGVMVRARDYGVGFWSALYSSVCWPVFVGAALCDWAMVRLEGRRKPLPPTPPASGGE